MPTLDEMTLEGPELEDKIVAQMYRIEQNLKAMGLGPMAPPELRYTHDRIKQGVVAAVQAQKQQKRQATGSPAGVARPPLPPPTQAPAPAPNLPLSTFAEGGLINDQSGQATQQIRNRLGVQ